MEDRVALLASIAINMEVSRDAVICTFKVMEGGDDPSRAQKKINLLLATESERNPPSNRSFRKR